jgi:hypothetical protein
VEPLADHGLEQEVFEVALEIERMVTVRAASVPLHVLAREDLLTQRTENIGSAGDVRWFHGDPNLE